MKDQRNIRTVSLIGEAGFCRLQQASVAVFGLGGVGSFAVEALARSGVGTLYLYDHDTVSESNCNRQLIAFPHTVGQLKTDLMAERCQAINPDIIIVKMPVFVTAQTEIPMTSFDFVIDAIDNVTAKLHLIEEAEKFGVPMISVMGMGNRLDPTSVTIGDIFTTQNCPLARVVRTQLRKRRIKKLPVVWSTELPKKPTEGELLTQSGRLSPASMCFVPATAGLTAASYAVQTLLKLR